MASSSGVKSGPTCKMVVRTAVTNKKSQCVCPICCDPIEDAVGKKGQDAVFVMDLVKNGYIVNVPASPSMPTL